MFLCHCLFYCIYFLIFLYENLMVQTSWQNIKCKDMTEKYILHLNNYSLFSLLCLCRVLVLSAEPLSGMLSSDLEILCEFFVTEEKALLSQSLNANFFHSFFLYFIHSFCVCVSHSVMPDSSTPWTVAHQAPLLMGFSRQEYCRGLPVPYPGDLSDPGIKLGSPTL